MSTNTLNPGDRLQHNEEIESEAGNYRLKMEATGNLVLSREEDDFKLWASNTDGSGKYAIMQTDGNFVIYNLADRAIWASNTAGHPGSYLKIQTDGNLVIYEPNVSIWATNTNRIDAIAEISSPNVCQ